MNPVDDVGQSMSYESIHDILLHSAFPPLCVLHRTHPHGVGSAE